MSNKKVSMENVFSLVDEFDIFVDKIDYLIKQTIGDEKGDDSLIFCLVDDVVENSKKKRNELWQKIRSESDSKKGSVFENDRLVEYAIQIRLDKHDPADILESWLKENKPDYFND
jgi:hypothetical protein